MRGKSLLVPGLILILSGCGQSSEANDNDAEPDTRAPQSETGGSSGTESVGAPAPTPGAGGAAATPTSGAPDAAAGEPSAPAGGQSTGGGSNESSGGTGGESANSGGGPASGTAGGASGVDIPPDATADGTMFGFAAYPALGVPTTTGGDGGQVVTVTTYDELVTHLGAPEAMVIQVSGTISSPDGNYVKLKVGSNKTVVGLGSDATLEHVGFDITGWGATEVASFGDLCEAAYEGQFTPVSNVIIQNLHFANTLGNSSDADGIVVECWSHHVWLDHNTFHGVESGNDGAIDIKRGADWITVSWNHIVAWDKVMLLGHVDDNGDQDRGKLHVTYHHNYFENTRQRHPRVRFAHAHLLNNYLHNDATVANRTASYFTVAGVEANLHAEGNLIEHAKEIYVIGEESSSDALLTYTETNLVVALDPNAEALYQIEPNGAGFDPNEFYDYPVDAADALRTLVPAGAGAGKL